MAFVSQTRPLRKLTQLAAIRFMLRRKKNATTGFGAVSSATDLRGKRFEIQLDEEKKLLRIKQSEDGLSVSRGGLFSCSKRLVEKVGSSTVTLELKEDGWLYGSYDGVEN